MKTLRFELLLIILGLIFHSFSASSEISRLRAAGNFGFGKALISNYNVGTNSYTEVPFGGSGSLEYFLDPLLDIGVEHIRSYGKNQTGVGLTGVSFKFYFLNDHPQYLAGLFSGSTNQLNGGVGYYYLKSITPYFGLGGGFAQATVPSDDVMAFNEYMSVKGGIDYPANSGWGYRCEGNIAFSLAGSGKITLFNLLFGLYFFL